MTLLSICQAVCNITPVAAPTTIVGNTTDQTATLLLALANITGTALAARAPGGWVSQQRQYEFQTASLAAQAGSIANSGAGGVAVISGLASTTGIADETWIASGPGVFNNSIVTAHTSTTVTLNIPASEATSGDYSFGQSDYTLPSDFTRPIDNTFWDRTNYWNMRGPLSPQQWQLYKSSVYGNTTIQRRFRFRYINGATRLSIDPTPFVTGAFLVFEYISNAWCETATGTPETSWTADTDVGVVSEYLLQLGLQWRFLRRLGISYDSELAEYEREVDKALATDGGAPVLNMTPWPYLSLVGPWNIPDGNFPGIGGVP